MNTVKDVDTYIEHAPKELQSRLKELRKLIKQTAPTATERMSYGMPYYDYNGRLVYFAYAKHHIGIYMPGQVIEDHKKELEPYETSKATIRFPLTEKLPLALIKKLIKARMKDLSAKN